MSEQQAGTPKVDPVWFEWRPIEGGFGVVAVENQVTQAATAPSPAAIQVADTTPLHAWQPGRQWLPGAGPDGIDSGSAALIAPTDAAAGAKLGM